VGRWEGEEQRELEEVKACCYEVKEEAAVTEAAAPSLSILEVKQERSNSQVIPAQDIGDVQCILFSSHAANVQRVEPAQPLNVNCPKRSVRYTTEARAGKNK
jgi:hypothetical protein